MRYAKVKIKVEFDVDVCLDYSGDYQRTRWENAVKDIAGDTLFEKLPSEFNPEEVSFEIVEEWEDK